MGYFATLAYAQRLAQVMRGVYPNAIATPAPAALLQQRNSGVPTLTPADAARRATASASANHAPVEDKTLTDTQVIRVLETRRSVPADEASKKTSGEIALLRPEDTDTRRVLKEAVVQGAPVSFAVQLLWSVQAIDLASVPSLSIFRAYTLYKTEGRREGRSGYCLRLGFFTDAISAKQVAYYVRSRFASVAVVPITEQERARASETFIDPSTLTDPLQERIDQTLDADRARTSSSPAGQAPMRPVEAHEVKTSASGPASTSESNRGMESLEQTLELLAASELWTDEASLTETGVRHLKVDVQKRSSRRS